MILNGPTHAMIDGTLSRVGPLQAEPDAQAAVDMEMLRLRRLAHAHAPRRVVVGLAGLPGAGKSTFAARLVAGFQAHEGPASAVALGIDGYHLRRAALARFKDPEQALRRRGAPWTFDAAALAERLRALRAMPDPGCGRACEIRWPGFSHAVGDPQPDAIAVPSSARLVLLEGLYLLHRADGWQLDGLLDACAYLDVPLREALGRLTQRHMASWGIDLAAARARIASNDRLNARIVAASRQRADWFVPAQCARF